MKKWLCVCLLMACPSLALGSCPFVPHPGKTLLVIGQDRDTIAHYVTATGTVPGGTMLYTSIQDMQGLNRAVEYGSGPEDGAALLHRYPNSVVQVGLYMVGGLGDTLEGTYDHNLLKLARWIKQSGRPVYLRIGYEFDNPSNHYDPQLYKEAFRYVVDFLRRQGVKNAAYVWHSQCADRPVDWMNWYPGDDYVDWFGSSIFSTEQIPVVSNFLSLARDHDKAFMICESSPWGMYTTRGKMDWFNHVFQFIKDQNIGVFCYIDSDWDDLPMFRGQHIGDARLEDDRDIKKLWLTEISHDRYLQASPNLF